MAAERRLAAIAFTDIVGYTALSQQDEPAALRLLQEQERLVQALLQIHRGRKVKSMGDGLLLEFPDALDAVEYAVDIQRHLHDRNARSGIQPLQLRIGIHLGDVEGVGSDILGDAVNVASRVEPLADPGGICLSQPVHVQVLNKVPYRVETLGPKSLKGVREPMEIYRVVLPWFGGGTPPNVPGPPRLAVLPLTNISPDPENEYFADGLTEEITSVLSQIRGLRVIARTSVGQYKGTSKSVSEIGSELGATSILEGSVRKAGKRLRISLQLIDVRSQEHTWSENYNRDLEDVFAIQADVAEQTARVLKLQLLTPERRAIAERPTASLAAYEAYLRGVQAQHRFFGRGTEEIDREAVRHFEDAIREDPSFAAAHAHLAEHLITVAGETRRWKDVTDQVRELIAKALELSPSSSEAHTAQGDFAMQVDHRWDLAEGEYQQAIELNPSNASARIHYGWLLATVQRISEARKQFLAAIEQDPLNVLPRSALGGTYSLEGNLAVAIPLSEKLVKEFPDNPGIRGGLGIDYALVGRVEDALRTVEPLANASDLTSRANRSLAMALLGRPGEARALLTEWEAGRLSGLFHARYAAVLYAALGDDERALALLEDDDRHGEKTLWNVYQIYVLDPIRDDPRFLAMLRGLNLPTTLSRPRWFPGRNFPA